MGNESSSEKSSNEKLRELLLIEASKRGDTGTVVALLKKGVDVNAKNEDGLFPLWLASYYGHLDVVKLLTFENKINIDETTDNGSTPLSASCVTGQSDVAFELIKRGADVNKARAEGSTPLIVASGNNHWDIVNRLIKNGAEVNATDNRGWTALHSAIWLNGKEAVKILLENGADTNMTDKNGRSALVIAHEANVPEIEDIVRKAASNGLKRAESENYSSFAEYLQKHKKRCDDEIKHLRAEREILLRARSVYRRVDVLSSLDQLAESVKEIRPKFISNEFNFHTTVNNENNNYGEKAGYQFFNSGQLDLAGQLSSEVGEGVVHLAIRIAELESEMEMKNREIAKQENSKKDERANETLLTEETPGVLRMRLDRVIEDKRLLEKALEKKKGEKAAQSEELRRTKVYKDWLEKRMKTVEDVLREELCELNAKSRRLHKALVESKEGETWEALLKALGEFRGIIIIITWSFFIYWLL